jgi:hypothetical protein
MVPLVHGDWAEVMTHKLCIVVNATTGRYEYAYTAD